MHHRISGILSLFGAFSFAAIWGVYLFGAQPDCLTSLQAATDSLIYALTPSESGYFLIGLLVSMLTCMLSSVLFFVSKYKKVALGIVAIHTLVGVFIYTIELTFTIALPLLFWRKILRGV